MPLICVLHYMYLVPLKVLPVWYRTNNTSFGYHNGLRLNQAVIVNYYYKGKGNIEI